MITLDNYEEYMIMHADGELQPHEEQALQAFLNDNPKLKAEMALYENISFAPDHSVVYAHKDSLMKPLAEKRVIAFPMKRAYAIAAGLAAVIIFTTVALYNNNGNVMPDTSVAIHHETKANTATPHANNPQPIAITEPKQITDTPTSILTTVKQIVPIQHATINNNNTGIAKVKTAHKNTDNQQVVATVNRHTTLSSQRVSSMKEIDVEKAELASLPMASAGNYTMPEIATEDEERHAWIDRLPITESKKKTLNNAATAIASGCEQISEIKDNVEKRGRGISLKIQHKNLVVSF